MLAGFEIKSKSESEYRRYRVVLKKYLIFSVLKLSWYLPSDSDGRLPFDESYMIHPW